METPPGERVDEASVDAFVDVNASTDRRATSDRDPTRAKDDAIERLTRAIDRATAAERWDLAESLTTQLDRVTRVRELEARRDAGEKVVELVATKRRGAK